MTIAFAILIALSGATLVTLGIRGRRFEPMPRCRRCAYDLRGSDVPRRCPECGASLEVAAAIRSDTIQRRPRWIGIGAVLLLLESTTIALDRAGLLSVARINDLSPTAVELWRATHGETDARVAAIDRLEERYRSSPDRVTPSQTLTLAELLIVAQTEPSMPWHRGWNLPIDVAVKDGSLPAASVERYLGQCFDGCVDVSLGRASIRGNDEIRLSFDRRPWRVAASDESLFVIRSGHADRFDFNWCASPIRAVLSTSGTIIGDPAGHEVGGFTLPGLFGRADAGGRSPFGYTARMPREVVDRLGAGTRSLFVELDYDVYNGFDPDRRVVARLKRSYNFIVDIVAAASPPVD